MPTPFKKCLVFPQITDKDLKTPKQRRKIFPAVVSSGKYREFYEKEIKKNAPKTKKLQPKSNIFNNESSSDSDMDVVYDDEDLDLSENENIRLKIQQHVIVKYEDKYYPGKK